MTTAPTTTETRLLHVTPAKCIGCGTCEMTCAFYHSHPLTKAPGKSRVKVLHFSEDDHVPMLCYQCDDAACVKVCNFNALKRNETTGAVEVIRDACVRCGMCVIACPFGNIPQDLSLPGPVKCDLCGGDPQCAKFCPTGALTFK